MQVGLLILALVLAGPNSSVCLQYASNLSDLNICIKDTVRHTPDADTLQASCSRLSDIPVEAICAAV